ncbi:hypothetical protein Tco_0708229 [Tanacetum coccineum]
MSSGYIPALTSISDLVPSEEMHLTPLLPPIFLSPRIQPLSPRRHSRGWGGVAAAASARQHNPLWPKEVDYSFEDTMETKVSIHLDRRIDYRLEMVQHKGQTFNQVYVHSRESSEFHSQTVDDAQMDLQL